MGSLNLNQSEGIRSDLTADEEAKIKSMYGRLADKVSDRADKLKDTPSSWDKETQLRGLAKQLQDAHDSMSSDMEEDFKDNMKEAAQAVVDDNKAWLDKAGISIQGAYSHVPKDVVDAIIGGKVYGKRADGSEWSLSGAIWQNNKEFKEDINYIIAQGIAENRSTFDIAKDLEKYVRGDAKKDFDWGKVYPGSRKVVDYNAQRLARTLVAHAFQFALVAATSKNPFVTGYIWHTANSHRVCPICEAMDGNFYEKNELPLDHPNGMCFWECAIPDSMEQIGERIGDWVNGNSDPELDIFADYLSGSSRSTSSDAKNVRNSHQPDV